MTDADAAAFDDPPASPEADPDPGPERLNAQCDGVVAIALTMLALAIRMPEGSRGPLRETLVEILPSVLSFLLSFAVISGVWLAQHRLTRRVRHTSRGFNLANIGYMLTLVSLSFPTAALARHGDSDPRGRGPPRSRGGCNGNHVAAGRKPR